MPSSTVTVTYFLSLIHFCTFLALFLWCEQFSETVSAKVASFFMSPQRKNYVFGKKCYVKNGHPKGVFTGSTTIAFACAISIADIITIIRYRFSDHLGAFPFNLLLFTICVLNLVSQESFVIGEHT